MSLDALGKNAYSELCKKRSAAHFAINRESPDPEKDPAYEEFINCDKELNEFKKNNVVIIIMESCDIQRTQTRKSGQSPFI